MHRGRAFAATICLITAVFLFGCGDPVQEPMQTAEATASATAEPTPIVTEELPVTTPSFFVPCMFMLSRTITSPLSPVLR